MQPGTRQMANKVPYMLIMDHNNPILPTLHSQFGRQLPKLVRLRALIHFEEIAVPATSCLNKPFRNALPARRRSCANTKAIRGVLGTLKGGGGRVHHHILHSRIFFRFVTFYGFGQSTIFYLFFFYFFILFNILGFPK